ncbi:MAG TPA: diadenylate cyclase CdaA [Pyrinomonadaceae bacterium]|jgi:diadenylate cyclase|nr:diadenylate cyclase CdaA [Pyrinomonadaceae bacterium]
MLLLLPYTEYLRRIVEPRNIADIVFVFLLVYGVMKLLRGTRAAPMTAGIAALVFFYWLSRKQELATLEFVLSNGLFYIGIAIIVLFQSEIRQALITFGNRFRVPLTRAHRGQFGEGVYDEIILAATTLASTKTGALIVIERNVGLKNVTDGGVKLDAELSYDLLVSIFNPASPLHDGAVVVRRHRIAAASCFLPLTLNPRLSKDLGTRHRAAIGVTEDTDAVAVVVSEETGLISFVQAGDIRRGLDATKLREAILGALDALPRKEKETQKPEAESESEEIAPI